MTRLFETAMVKEALSIDLPDISTKDGNSDTLYLLEDHLFLHIEYQTTVKKHDGFPFAGFVMSLYNKYNGEKRILISPFNAL